MRDVLKSRAARWLQAGWVFPLALLMLPNCMFDSSGMHAGEPLPPPPLTFEPGDQPHSGAIMCDIPKVPARGVFECAQDGDPDLQNAMALTHAAVALAEGKVFGSLGLDYSEGAFSACGDGTPRKIDFHGTLPQGLQVCLNCAQIPAEYVDPTAACVAKCVDLTKAGENQPAEGAQTWCEANAKVSTNFTQTCIGEACTPNGMPQPFDDQRKYQEPVTWNVQGFAQVSGDELVKIGEDADLKDWDSGGVSTQIIEGGDAWVEFQAGQLNGKSHVLGVASGAVDGGPQLEDVGHALSLNWDGQIHIVENYPTYVSAPIGTFLPEDRFRIRITDNHDGTASIKYVRLDGPCADGTECLEEELGPQNQPNPQYPLRINASFREPDASFKKVTLVRIRKP